MITSELAAKKIGMRDQLSAMEVRIRGNLAAR